MTNTKKDRNITPVRVSKKAFGIIDSRVTENERLLIKRQGSVPMQKLFGSERKAAVAFFMSDLICKGFNDDELCTTVNEKYHLEWGLKEVKIMKTLIHRLWRIQMAADMNEQIRQEVAVINMQLKELWAAWEFSKKGVSEKTTRKTNSDSSSDMMSFNQTETILKEDVCAGDPKYMSLINELGKEKRKLLGLYAPEKKSSNDMPTAVQINVVGSDGTNAIKAVLEKGAQTLVDAEAEVLPPIEMIPQEATLEEDIDIDAIYESMINDDNE
ncbi:MAG: hypothetical protein NC083_08755 [Muribaculum sp.]|nr:hypothetical protein [Muribaculum sp.]MCM1577048.1 hypothetical protein [Bacteroides sp.]